MRGHGEPGVSGYNSQTNQLNMDQDTFEQEILEKLTVSGLGELLDQWKIQRDNLRLHNAANYQGSPDYNLVQAMVTNFSEYREIIDKAVPGTVEKIRAYRLLQEDLIVRLGRLQKASNQNIALFKGYL